MGSRAHWLSVSWALYAMGSRSHGLSGTWALDLIGSRVHDDIILTLTLLDATIKS
jgi:hypothetical protein